MRIKGSISSPLIVIGDIASNLLQLCLDQRQRDCTEVHIAGRLGVVAFSGREGGSASIVVMPRAKSGDTRFTLRPIEQRPKRPDGFILQIGGPPCAVAPGAFALAIKRRP